MIRKVHEGMPMPAPMATSSQGEMPIFSYLTTAEIAAAHMYLSSYPPQP